MGKEVYISISLLLLNIMVSGYSQDATESPTSTIDGSLQMEFATSHESYLQGEIKNDLNTLFSGLFLYGITANLELRSGIDFREELLRENGIVQSDRLNGLRSRYLKKLKTKQIRK